MAKPRMKMVKSAQRVVEVLEFFGEHRREATVMDFVRQLDYPQSSASELLRSLVELGYLQYDRLRRTYRPTLKAALANNWLWPGLFREGQLISRLDRLASETGQDVVLAALHGHSLTRVHASRAPTASAAPTAPYAARAPFISALGRVILASWPEKAVRDLVRRLNAEESDPTRWFKPADLIADLANVAALGYAVSPNEPGTACGMVAVPLEVGGQGLALGIGCRPHHIRDAAGTAAMLQEIIEDAQALAERTSTPAPPYLSAPGRLAALLGRV